MQFLILFILSPISLTPLSSIPLITCSQTDNPYSNIDDFVDSFSDTDSEYEEEEPVGAPIIQLRDKRDTTIDIIGSLCLQGVLQGLIPEEEGASGPMQILPSSILMTSNLEGQNAALDELSVMIVAKSSDIVPETPYDPNNTITGTGRGRSARTGKAILM